jgi:hypothetical protein
VLVWGVVLVVVFEALLFAGMFAFGYPAAMLLPGSTSAVAIVATVGGLAGLMLGIFVYHRAPRWMQRILLHRLRSTGVRGSATVAWSQTRHKQWGKGLDTTTVTVRFTWSDASGEHSHERKYRFIADPPKGFAPCVARGARVPIRYPADRPDRFIVDIGYAPVMVDQFL